MVESEAADVLVRAIEGGVADEVLHAHRVRARSGVGGRLAILEKEFAAVASSLLGRECYVALTMDDRGVEEKRVFDTLAYRYACIP